MNTTYNNATGIYTLQVWVNSSEDLLHLDKQIHEQGFDVVQMIDHGYGLIDIHYKKHSR
jgi:hypothetical protein